MAKDGAGGKPVADTGAPRDLGPRTPGRHVYGPRTLATLLPPITRPAFKSRSPAAAQLMSDWPALVGPVTAAVTSPRRFSGGTLTLAASGVTALELQHLATQLIARINSALGRQVVERLRFVQDDSITGAGSAAPEVAAPEPVPVAIGGLPDGPLHDALARLGGRIASRSRS
ncbi:DUF721 domain-containing protein [Lichenicola sp.]|uniref:DUF721 domain-containing protein n=1 Tax=Lichenicola sp. TaxID=2804529 RepID=UPI003AFF6A85